MTQELNIIVAPGDSYQLHRGHPENKDRIYSMIQILDNKGLAYTTPLPLSQEQILSKQFIPHPQIIAPAHKQAAGAIYTGILAVVEGDAAKSLICARPPAHHSPRISYGIRGFCAINSDAVALATVLQNNPDMKVAIVDTDAHHADGTEDFFFYHPQVLHISIHQDGRTIFPGTGCSSVLGPPVALGKTRNIPLPPDADDSYLIAALQELVLPLLQDFDPDLIIHAVGFDGHKKDPLSFLQYSSEVFGMATALLQPHITIIQGGYDLKQGVPKSFQSTLQALLHEDAIQVRAVAVPEHIQGIAEHWQQSLQEQENIDAESWSRDVHFFYDEEYALEYRRETIETCSHCMGIVTMESYWDKTGEKSDYTLLLNPNCPHCSL